jgi:CRISPR/Cas system-associated protein Cas10 (large subunit of type III CRISPR-Cas system)
LRLSGRFLVTQAMSPAISTLTVWNFEKSIAFSRLAYGHSEHCSNPASFDPPGPMRLDLRRSRVEWCATFLPDQIWPNCSER